MYFLAGAKNLDRLCGAKFYLGAVKKSSIKSGWDQKIDKKVDKQNKRNRTKNEEKTNKQGQNKQKNGQTSPERTEKGFQNRLRKKQ